MRRPLDLRLTEWVEFTSFVLAITLVLRLFVFEAFTIPTGSMQPTILGDEDAGVHDRILADKLVTLLRPPRRWEVLIFRLPFDPRQLYVKRLAGLGGETLELAGGDVWIDGAIARKPDGVLASMLRRVAPPLGAEDDLGAAFRPTGSGIVVRGGRATFAPNARGGLRLRRTVRDRDLDGYDPAWGITGADPGRHAVADLQVSLQVALADDAEQLELAIIGDDGTVRFELPRLGAARAARVVFEPTDAAVEARPGPDGVRAPYAERGPAVLLDDPRLGLPAGRPARIVARWVDRRVVLAVDGDEWLRVDQDDLGPRPDPARRALVTLALPGGGEVAHVVLDRDVYYAPHDATRRWAIPPGALFFLGDNTRHSLDSRAWELRTLVLPDEAIEGFWTPGLGGEAIPGANPVARDDGLWDFADTFGDVHEIDPVALLAEHGRPSPFVPADRVLGKVLAVYWPIWRPFRWKLVR